MQAKTAALATALESVPVVPVLVVHDLAHAAPLARALVAGGLTVLEVTLRTPVALDAVRAMIDAVPNATVGTGTVRTPADLEASRAAGAAFAVSPGAGPKLLDAAQDHPLPLLPGVATPSEAMTLDERGYRFLKFFPAVANGGPAVLKAWSSPLAGLRFCPTGGVKLATAPTWLSLPNVVCVGGSWVAPKAAIAEGAWDTIEALAREASGLSR